MLVWSEYLLVEESPLADGAEGPQRVRGGAARRTRPAARLAQRRAPVQAPMYFFLCCVIIILLLVATYKYV